MEILKESYYNDKQLEFMTLMKPGLTKDFAFLIVATKETQETFLQCGFTYNWEKIKASIIQDKQVGNTLDLWINTTLIANNLPQRESQATFVKFIKKIFKEDNIIDVTFGTPSRHAEGEQSGWCHIQCLNAVVYI